MVFFRKSLKGICSLMVEVFKGRYPVKSLFIFGHFAKKEGGGGSNLNANCLKVP